MPICQYLSNVVEDINVGKLLGKVTKKVFDWYKEKRIINRFKGITDVWNLFDKNQPNITKHISEFERVSMLKFKS